MFVFIDVTIHISRSVVNSTPFYSNTSTHTDLLVRRSALSGSVMTCFFRIEESFLYLYALTLAVICQGQWLNWITFTAAPTHRWTYRSDEASDLEV